MAQAASFMAKRSVPYCVNSRASQTAASIRLSAPLSASSTAAKGGDGGGGVESESGVTAAKGGNGGDVESESGVTGFVGGAAREAVETAVETADKMENAAKRTLDTAFDAAKGTSQKLNDTVVAEADENVVDTTEYRSIEDRLSNPANSD